MTFMFKCIMYLQKKMFKMCLYYLYILFQIYMFMFYLKNIKDMSILLCCDIFFESTIIFIIKDKYKTYK
jgi:hypothetical protein